MTVASDVTNTLCGPVGAPATYGPQKGCDEWAVQELDRALLHWGRWSSRPPDAGGRPAWRRSGRRHHLGLIGFTSAVIRAGVDVVAEAVGLAKLLAADLVITGEGQADEQTLSGKAAMGVAALARGNATPVILLCGSLGPGAAALDASGAFAVVLADRRSADAPGRVDARHRAAAGQRRRARGAHTSRSGCAWPSRAPDRVATAKPSRLPKRKRRGPSPQKLAADPAQAAGPGRGGARATG